MLRIRIAYYSQLQVTSRLLYHIDITYPNILHRYEANSYFIQEILSYTSIVLHNIYYYFEFSFIFCYSHDVSRHSSTSLLALVINS